MSLISIVSLEPRSWQEAKPSVHLAPFSHIPTVFCLSLPRLTPYEWYNPHPCIKGRCNLLINQYSLGNSFWFPVGGFMQQGSAIAPRALSTRCVSGVWLVHRCYLLNLSYNFAISCLFSSIVFEFHAYCTIVGCVSPLKWSQTSSVCLPFAWEQLQLHRLSSDSGAVVCIHTRSHPHPSSENPAVSSRLRCADILILPRLTQTACLCAASSFA